MGFFPLSYMWKTCIPKWSQSDIPKWSHTRAFLKLFMIGFEHPLCLPDDYEDLTSHF